MWELCYSWGNDDQPVGQSWIELGHAKLTEFMENVLLIWAWVKIQALANHRFLAYVYLCLVLTDGQLSKYWGSRRPTHSH